MTDSMDSARSGNSTVAPRPLSLGLNVRLSLMFFLQYAIWGAWLPLLWPFLAGHRKFEPSQIGDIFAVGALGAVLAPFIAGQIADRYFATQRFLGISHLLGAVLVWQLAELESYGAFLVFSLCYSVVFSPTLSLTNSLAFHHLPDRNRDFGRVRVWGTVGWICAGIGVAQLLAFYHTPGGATDEAAKAAAQAAGMADAFRFSAVLGAVLGVYCFLLPHTPPQPGKQAFATWEARDEVQRNPRLMALFLFAIIISCIHQFYFVHTASFLGQFQNEAGGALEAINKIFGVGGGGLMTIGQMSEMVVLACMPFLAMRLARKSLLALGIFAYAVRMALFAYVQPITAATGLSPIVTLVAGIAMHGLCFGCFIFVAYMIVDEETTPDVRASAQGLFNVVIIGLGIVIGSKIASIVAQWATTSVGSTEKLDYSQLFNVPMWAALLTLIVFLFLYPGKKHSAQSAD